MTVDGVAHVTKDPSVALTVSRCVTVARLPQDDKRGSFSATGARSAVLSQDDGNSYGVG